MNRRILAMLITLNALLLAVLTLVWHDQSTPTSAEAQFAGGGSFTMVSASIRGVNQDVVYVIDQNTGSVGAITFNGPRKKFEGFGARDLASDLNRLRGGGGGR